MRPCPTAEHVAAIYSAAWWVRYWCRPHQREKKAEAILALGFVVRAAFNAGTDFAPLLYAIAEALKTER